MDEPLNEDAIVSVRVQKFIKDMIDSDRKNLTMSRSTWINVAIAEKLARQGYEFK